jgi:hypothetical protein
LKPNEVCRNWLAKLARLPKAVKHRRPAPGRAADSNWLREAVYWSRGDRPGLEISSAVEAWLIA